MDSSPEPGAARTGHHGPGDSYGAVWMAEGVGLMTEGVG
jgi:hypothetical protein